MGRENIKKTQGERKKRTALREREEKRPDIGREKKKDRAQGERRNMTRHRKKEEKGKDI